MKHSGRKGYTVRAWAERVQWAQFWSTRICASIILPGSFDQRNSCLVQLLVRVHSARQVHIEAASCWFCASSSHKVLMLCQVHSFLCPFVVLYCLSASEALRTVGFSVLAAGTSESAAAAGQSCWSGTLTGSCGSVSAKAATEVVFFLLLKTGDGSICSQTCASSSTVTATLDGATGVVVPGTCDSGACAFKWSSPTSEKSGVRSLDATIGGTAVATTPVAFNHGQFVVCPRAHEMSVLQQCCLSRMPICRFSDAV